MYNETSYNEDKTLKTYKFVGQVFLINFAYRFYEMIDFKRECKK
ncbi:MAG: hypothetical protein R2837_10110 [Aliarcobacter sp.]